MYKIEDTDQKINFIIGGRGSTRRFRFLQRYLLTLNFNVNSIGFNYWITAIELYKENYYKYNNTLELIYADIAKRNNTTRNRVERAMRTASATAKETIKEKYNYNYKITTKTILELICNVGVLKYEVNR